MLPKNDPKKLLAALKEEGAAFDADLRGVKLDGQKLAEVFFRGTKLAKASLRNCVLAGCGFSDADLTGANLAGVKLSQSFSSNACFKGADLTRARIFGEGDFTSADFSGARAAGLEMADVQAIGAKFVGAKLAGAKLAGVELGEADFSRADLTGADLSGATLTGANLTGATLDGANLDGATWDEKTRWPGEPPAEASYVGKKKLPAPKKKALGEVSTFGEPILLIDAKSASGGVKWDIEGEGTAYLFAGAGGGLLLVRPWIDDGIEDEAAAAALLAGEKGSGSKKLGRLHVPSGKLALRPGKRVIAVKAKQLDVHTDKVKGKAGEAIRCHLVPA